MQVSSHCTSEASGIPQAEELRKTILNQTWKGDCSVAEKRGTDLWQEREGCGGCGHLGRRGMVRCGRGRRSGVDMKSSRADCWRRVSGEQGDVGDDVTVGKACGSRKPGFAEVCFRVHSSPGEH